MSEEQVRVTADDSEAQETIARAEAQVEQLHAHVAAADLRVAQSLTSAISGITAVANIGFSVLDIFGVAVDEVLKAAIGAVLNYAQQLALAATATSMINPAYAAALATVALTVQVRAIQMQAQGAKEAKEGLDKARRLMDQVTQSLIIFTRK